MNAIELLRSRAAAFPDAPAIIDARCGRSRVFSFAELERASARAAGLLHAAGLRPGDGVLVSCRCPPTCTSPSLPSSVWGWWR